MNGKVKFFNVVKNFGFIDGDDDKSYFVHVSQVSDGTELHENDEVTFTPTETEKGPQATNVELA